MTDKKRCVCFTGHRAIGSAAVKDVEARLDVVIERCIGAGYRNFISGGALGFDTLAANRVLSAKKKHPDVTLTLILPCRDQTKLWTNLDNINEYRHLKDAADEIVYIREFYDASCMIKRNERMVDSSSLCVAYFNGKAGGTQKTISYAKEKGVAVINLFTGSAR